MRQTLWANLIVPLLRAGGNALRIARTSPGGQASAARDLSLRLGAVLAPSSTRIAGFGVALVGTPSPCRGSAPTAQVAPSAFPHCSPTAHQDESARTAEGWPGFCDALRPTWAMA